MIFSTAMLRSAVRLIVLLAVAQHALVFVAADFDVLEFPSNATDYICPGIDFACVAPAICAHEFTTDQYYCCLPINGACRRMAQTCGISPAQEMEMQGSPVLVDGTPRDDQIRCTLSDASTFCCADFE